MKKTRAKIVLSTDFIQAKPLVMKTIISLLSFMFIITVHAQKIIPKHKKIITYKVSIVQKNGKHFSGYLSGFSDSMVYLLPYDISKSKIAISRHETFDSFSFRSISRISFRRKNSTLRGILFGGLTGSALGLMAGAMVGQQTRTSKGENTWFFTYVPAGTQIVTESAYSVMTKLSFFGAAAGEIIGGTIGLFATKKFSISGSKENFDSVRNIMLPKLYR